MKQYHMLHMAGIKGTDPLGVRFKDPHFLLWASIEYSQFHKKLVGNTNFKIETKSCFVANGYIGLSKWVYPYVM